MDTSGVIQLVSIVISDFSVTFSLLPRLHCPRSAVCVCVPWKRKAASVLHASAKFWTITSKMISTILIGNNICQSGCIFPGNNFGYARINLAVGIAAGVLTIVVLLCGGSYPGPGQYCILRNLALTYCNVIYFLMQVLTPVIFIVDLLSHGIMKLYISVNKNPTP